MMARSALLVLMAGLAAQPAFAAASISIPEPENAWLFALGVAGLILGRQAARRKPPE